MIETDRFAKIEITHGPALWDWLAQHGDQAESVWLVTHKKHCGARHVSREAVLDALIAHGWTDGLRRKLDADRTMQLIAPRQQAGWTATYRRRAKRLIAEGRMQPRGQAAVDQARRSGMWEALPDVDALIVPSDLAIALGGARHRFEALAPSYRRNLLRWLANAKRDATKAKRVAIIADSVRAGTKLPNF